MSKKSLFMVIILGAMLIFASCSSDSPVSEPAPIEAPVEAPAEAPAETQEAADEITFTLEELRAFNGKDGNPAYIAVNGVVYDVTNSSRWKEGMHNGFEAGKDLTEEIVGESPHGLRVLDNVPVVGKIAD